MKGSLAERFIRYRDTTKKGSNNDRMKRQLEYLPALLQALRQAGADGDYYEKFGPLLEPYLVTDMTAEQLNELIDYEVDWENVVYVPGEVKAGEVNEEFHVDDAKLRELLLEMFYEQVDSNSEKQ